MHSAGFNPFLGIWLFFELLVILAIIGAIGASFFMKRHRESPSAQTGWARTNEVFRDPSTGRVMRVWVDELTGERHYVPD